MRRMPGWREVMAHEHDNCRHLLGSLSDYVDTTLEGEICAEIERHLSECENCRVVVDTLRKTVSIVHTTHSDPKMPEDVRVRLYKRLDLDEYIRPTNPK
jgi:predicted anti-sigma-YlaC factor YlaD